MPLLRGPFLGRPYEVAQELSWECRLSSSNEGLDGRHCRFPVDLEAKERPAVPFDGCEERERVVVVRIHAGTSATNLDSLQDGRGTQASRQVGCGRRSAPGRLRLCPRFVPWRNPVSRSQGPLVLTRHANSQSGRGGTCRPNDMNVQRRTDGELTASNEAPRVQLSRRNLGSPQWIKKAQRLEPACAFFPWRVVDRSPLVQLSRRASPSARAQRRFRSCVREAPYDGRGARRRRGWG